MSRETHQQNPSLSRVYVNAVPSEGYADYDSFSPSWSAPDDYEIVRKLGRGKYSEVFEGQIATNSPDAAITSAMEYIRNQSAQSSSSSAPNHLY